MLSEWEAHHRRWRKRNPLTWPGDDKGSGISDTGLTASAAKKEPHENLYVSERPNGIAAPNKSAILKVDSIQCSSKATHHPSQSISKKKLQSRGPAVGIALLSQGPGPQHISHTKVD